MAYWPKTKVDRVGAGIIPPSGVAMENSKLQQALEARDRAEQEIEKLRMSMTILFSDIKDSTRFAEKKGDVEYMAMINRHNSILFPVIEAEGGRVVKTLGDSILAKFDDPIAAVRAAAGMQRALAKDREGRDESDQIRIRIGLHYGMGLVKDNDVFGDVVNAASRVEHQAEAEQILITDVLLDAATAAGFQCAKMGRAEMRGKDEPIDLYAVAWSQSATQQLIQEIQAKYEKQVKEMKKQHAQLEEEFENAREQWRADRRTLNAELEALEESLENANATADQQLHDELQSESLFRIEELKSARAQLEQDLASAQQKFEAERNNLKAQIAGMQATVVDAMERANNPARIAMIVREQVEARVAEEKQHWKLEWEGERKRLLLQIDRLQKAPHVAEEKKEAARRVLLEKLGKRPPSPTAGAAKTEHHWEREFQEAKIQWDTEREQLKLKIKKLETELHRAQAAMRSEISQEMRSQYEARLADANRERQQLEQDIQSVTSELAVERQRLTLRIKALEKMLPEAQEATRKQVLAELQSEFDAKLQEANRRRSRTERKYQDLIEDFEAERLRTSRQISALEEQLKEAKEVAYKAQKGFSPVTSLE